MVGIGGILLLAVSGGNGWNSFYWWLVVGMGGP